MSDLVYSFTLTNGTTADADEVQTMFEEVRALVNGNLGPDNIGTPLGTDQIADEAATVPKLGTDVVSLLQALGTNIGHDAGEVARGKAVVPGLETRSNASFGLMPTPDRVQNVVVPAEALLVVDFSALWKSSAGFISHAAIFIGANQLKIATQSTGAPVTQEAGQDISGFFGPLLTFPGGLVGQHGAQDNSLVSTGMAADTHRTGTFYQGSTAVEIVDGPWGTPCVIRGLAAGTYDISVQFRTTGGGTVSVENRSLKVEVIGF